MKHDLRTHAVSEIERVEHLLPDVIQALIRLIGLPRTLEIVKRMGGITWPVSKNISKLGEARYQYLAEVVGVEAADKITQHFGGESIKIPKCERALLELRDRRLRADYDELVREMSGNDAVMAVAIRYRLDDRWIYRLLKKMDSDAPAGMDSQLGLF